MINILKPAFIKAGYPCLQASSDADYLIVKTAVELRVHENATVVSDDTNVFVMLLLHYNPQREERLNWFSEASSRSKDGPKVIFSTITQRARHSSCSNILFVHSWFGCNTTSYIHGH